VHGADLHTSQLVVLDSGRDAGDIRDAAAEARCRIPDVEKGVTGEGGEAKASGRANDRGKERG
jgi:hypothetical protein